MDDADGLRYTLGELVLVGSDIAKARPRHEVLNGEPSDFWALKITLTRRAAELFASATGRAASAPPPRNQIAFILDGVIVSAPTVAEAILGANSRSPI